MEKRRFERKKVYLKAERISGDENRAVFIENISEHGIQIITVPAESIIEFFPGTPIDLKFELSSGDTINLNCAVRWSYHNSPPDDITTTIGMEIIDPPLRYREFVKNLS
ncbi:MAG: PilZ domain-containing protein [Nitrospirae bacterium]|nr:PilZ domain-containing protein [Nitrospirota bacterium]